MSSRGPSLLPLLALTAFAVVPSLAFAADTKPLMLDFSAGTPMGALLGKTIGVAKSFLPLAAIVAFVLEAFGKAPTQDRDYGAVLWRIVVVLLLLWNYQPLFGSVISLCDKVASQVTPADPWQSFDAQTAAFKQAMAKMSGAESQAAGQGAGQATPPAQPDGAASGGTFGGFLYDTGVSLIMLLCEAIVFIIVRLSRILSAAFFILGPLALVAAIPRPSQTGGKWFSHFVTYSSWPIFSGVLLSIVVALSAQGMGLETYLGSIVAAGVMAATAIAAPVIASHVVGGTLQNLASTGFHGAQRFHRDFVRPPVGAALSIRDVIRDRLDGGNNGGSGGAAQAAGRGIGGAVAGPAGSVAGGIVANAAGAAVQAVGSAAGPKGGDGAIAKNPPGA